MSTTGKAPGGAPFYTEDFLTNESSSTWVPNTRRRMACCG